MTKRELNKLPAGGLTAALLHGLGLKDLVNVALHCFKKWKDEQFMRSFHGKQVNELSAIHQKTLAANEEFFEDNEFLEAKCNASIRAKIEAQQSEARLSARLAVVQSALTQADKTNERILAENQRLKQHLATQLVPVPDNPGLAFISYPN